jgi:predicted dehydrogenase
MALTGTESYPHPLRKLRLGMVGGGRGALVGHWHWTGARNSNRWDLMAVALSSDPEVARESGRDWLIDDDRNYTDYEVMAKAESEREDGIDAVAICTPNWTHQHIAEIFMDHGIDIICDKPIAISSEQVSAMKQKQLETGLVFAVSHPYVFHPMVRQAAEMVRDGQIGQVTQVLVEYAQDWGTGALDPSQNKQLSWRVDPAKVGRASCTGDIGTHALQLLEYVSNIRVEKLRADFFRCGRSNTMEDTVFMGLSLEGGVPGSMWLTQAAPGNYCALNLRIFGDKGGLEWKQEFPEHLRFTPLDQPEQILVRGHGSGINPSVEKMVILPRGHGESLSDAWGNLYREIAIAVEARREGKTVPNDLIVLPDLEIGARGVKFIETAADSHEAGGVWQSLESN